MKGVRSVREENGREGGGRGGGGGGAARDKDKSQWKTNKKIKSSGEIESTFNA